MKFKSFILNLFTVLLVTIGMISPVAAANTEDNYPFSYIAHVAEIGWQNWVDSPEMAGTTGKGLPIEAISVTDPEDNIKFSIQAHVQDLGWMKPNENGQAGTIGQAKQLECIRINLIGDSADNYDVSYRTHVANIGWQNWVKNGEEAGTTGQGLGIEAICIKVTPKDDTPEDIPNDPNGDTTDTDDASDFVALDEIAPDIMQEVRYYSTYNFVGDRIDGYEQPTILMTREAAEAVKAVNDSLMEKGYRLKVYDAYRPQMAVDHFVRWAQDLTDIRMKPYFYPEEDKSTLFDKGYIAKYSGHTRGSTIDLTIFDMNTGKDLDMGGTFDYFGELSHPDYTDITPEQYANRMVLREAMMAQGFRPLSTEWWHFTLNNEPYDDTYFTFPVNKSVLNK